MPSLDVRDGEAYSETEGLTKPGECADEWEQPNNGVLEGRWDCHCGLRNCDNRCGKAQMVA